MLEPSAAGIATLRRSEVTAYTGSAYLREFLMANRLRLTIAAALLSCSYAMPAYAQDPSPASPAPAPPNLAHVEGAVEVVQDGAAERANPPLMLLGGDLVRTRGGRAEVVFGDGTLLHVNTGTELEFLDRDRLRLITGRVIVRVARGGDRYTIDTPASPVVLDTEGEYTISSDREGRLEVAVSRGLATVQEPSPWTIRGAQMLTLGAPGARPLIQTFNSARLDAFAAWSYERTNGLSSSTSASQLPYELRPYGPVLDTYGRWDYVAPHGYVWFPSVASDWRPYYDGSWTLTRYGWTWHGHDRWAWPTHHYGRWGFNGSFWYWIPSTVWAPAWVGWNVVSGYVSWSPLGWDNRPALPFWRASDHPAYWPADHGWRGWTILPRRDFAPRRHVLPHAVDPGRLDPNTRRALAQAVPLTPAVDVAVPRDALTIPGARGNVRRPSRTYPPDFGGTVGSRSAAPPAPAATAPPVAVPDTTPSRRPADHPAYAPPRIWNSGDARRGGDRHPDAAARPADVPTTRTPAVPRVQPRDAGERPAAAPPPNTPPPAGAVPRDGGSRRAPRAGGASAAGEGAPPAAAPPPATPPAAAPAPQGGARRRPPA